MEQNGRVLYKSKISFVPLLFSFLSSIAIFILDNDARNYHHTLNYILLFCLFSILTLFHIFSRYSIEINDKELIIHSFPLLFFISPIRIELNRIELLTFHYGKAITAYSKMDITFKSNQQIKEFNFFMIRKKSVAELYDVCKKLNINYEYFGFKN
jgi:hypothetical protein